MIIKAKIKPKSSPEGVTYQEDIQTYIIKVNVAPERGKANLRVINLLSNYFKIRKTNIRILSGYTSPVKLIEIDNDIS